MVESLQIVWKGRAEKIKMSRKKKDKTQTRVLEEFGYSSQTWRVLEKITTYHSEWSGTSSEYVEYRVEITHHSGESGYTTQSFPITHVDGVSQIIAALTRTKEHIVNRPKERSLSGRNRPIYRTIENGLKLDQVWSPEIVVSEYGTVQELLGHNHIEPDSGRVVRFEPAINSDQKVGSGGSRPSWHIDEIGMTVDRANARRQELGIKGPEYSETEDEPAEDLPGD